MASTGKQVLRTYDTPFANAVGTADPITTSTDTTIANLSNGPAPEDLVYVNTVYMQSMTTPRAVINVIWTQPLAGVTDYLVQVADNSSFSGARTLRVHDNAAALEVDAPTVIAVFYRIRVAALYGQMQSDWSNTLTVEVDPDLSAPDAPTGLSVSFDSNANLNISFTKAVGNNVRDTNITIYSDSSHTTLYELVYIGGSSYTWTAAQNLARTGGAGLETPWVEVRTRSYNLVFSSEITGTATMPRPSTPTGVGAVINPVTGETQFSWNASTNATRYDLLIDGVNRSVSNTRYAYSFDQNKQEHGGAADYALSFTVTAYNALGYGSGSVSSAVVLPVPTVATLAGASFAGPDMLIAWTDGSPVASHVLTLDGVARTVTDSSYVYPFDMNRSEHSGTPDPSIAYSIVGVDIFGQTSSALTGTVVNAVPDAPTAVNVQAGSASVLISTTATEPPDFSYYTYRVERAGVTTDTFTSTEKNRLLTLDASGSYIFGVTVTDVFNQTSAETVSDAVQLDILTIAMIRAEATYDDDLGTAATALAVLKDENLVSSGVTYPAI